MLARSKGRSTEYKGGRHVMVMESRDRYIVREEMGGVAAG